MLNQFTLQGRMVKDPELQTSNSGKKYLNFSIAHQKSKESTLFFDCVAFDKIAEFVANYFKKGDMILISGEFEYSDKDGKRYYKIILRSADFCGSKKDNG